MHSNRFELGYNVSNKIKIQISNRQYVKLGGLMPNASDLDAETQLLSVKDSCLEMASKPKAEHIIDTEIWSNLFLLFSSIYT